MRLLLVEDEKNTAKAVAEILRKNHYTVDLKYDGEDGLYCALTGIHDIIILDIMLPCKDGLSLLKEIRRADLNVPVILLSAKGEIEDKVKGLNLGADDYLAKPFHTDELLARIRALNRRKPQFHNDGILTFGDLRLSPNTLFLSSGDCETKLKLKEAQILELLLAHQNQIIPKMMIMEKIWGYDAEVETNQVEVHVSRLRHALARVRSRTKIRAIRGVGYTLMDARET